MQLELLLAIDSSTSVNRREYALQRDGLANAFRDEGVLRSIRSLQPLGLVISVVQWSERGRQITSVPWTRISGRASAEAFAARLATMPRAVRGMTDIAGALDFSRISIQQNAYRGARMVIDVSGDGSSGQSDPSSARDRAVNAGITVNGLVIHSKEYDLGTLADIDLFQHYSQRVTGGPGSFVMEAANYNDFADSIRRKLIREISGADFAELVPSR
ncbi:DUF1194 domain-containing protein [Ahrensia sp. R2A130]|uniref:DUF1194 domain-containing protein n=1 Tax=Ahrensia sp. R2A130 TaxID=744979 RepID=UPI0002F08F81|nr:DUF1194 domain-containing protein [Ahrensia sp. R2A130]